MTMNKTILTACSLLLAATMPAYASETAEIQMKTKMCVQCHGPDGNSPSAEFPRLAGQHQDYLAKALRDYKSGVRKNAIMAPMVANLTARDIDEIAEYYSKQKGLATKH
jgi:cytochrome c553